MTTLLIALHGYGGTGADMAQALSAGHESVPLEAPDGPVRASLVGRGRAWYPLTSQMDLVRQWSREVSPDVARLVRAAQARHGASPDRTVLVGFSQGASVAAALLRHSPLCHRVVLACGRLPDGAPPCEEVLTVTGEDDPFVRTEDVRTDVGAVRARHVTVPGVGHEFTHDVAQVALAFATGPQRSHE
ncbi:hypothetical protein IEQ44_08320 [Nocardioides sp. Y6]|uniref:Phospholipase/carboxylesterase/thioesterase domain-containing protein n=1 Tax=Nocardioides malaquae TaxID=2773426 RepID=A0ABR9RSV2_9ACTN|nr:hypothetical protein [Nocardioides malaquae]MBE7324656.1 hypothetical protein [Nocardioides malaquae]